MVNNSANFNKTNNHHSPLLTKHKKTSTYDLRNPDPDLEQAQTYDGVKLFNGISTLPFWLLDRQPKYIYKQTIKYLHRFASTQKVHILSQKKPNEYGYGV